MWTLWVWKGEDETSWEGSIDICTLLCVKWIACGELLYSPGSSAQGSVMTYRSGVGFGQEDQEGKNICIHIADPLCCTAESNTTLQGNYITI